MGIQPILCDNYKSGITFKKKSKARYCTCVTYIVHQLYLKKKNLKIKMKGQHLKKEKKKKKKEGKKMQRWAVTFQKGSLWLHSSHMGYETIGNVKTGAK